MLRFNIPEQITATFCVITPMFIGDGQQNAHTIYPQSVKGALRFWWRALMWQECRTQAGDDAAALRQLHAWESALFGSLPEQGKKGREAAFSLRVNSKEVPQKHREISWPSHGNSPSGYLGMGIWADNKNPHREGLPKLGQEYSFTVILTLNSGITAAQKAQLTQTLQLFGLFGGLGSRARRGFGSIQLQCLNGQACTFSSQEAYEKAARALMSTAEQASPAPYTALSKDSAFTAVSGFGSAEAAHAALGTAYKNYRGQPSHLRGAKKKVFGLPLMGIDDKSRRASPLLFHIFQLDKGDYGFSVLHLPASAFHDKHQDANFALTAGFLKQVQEV